jgi:AcrR family transcriptional regulator
MDARAAKATITKTNVRAPAVSLRAQLKQLTRERLVNSAIELFGDKGFRATSVAEIAAAAGTTSTTFYRYFATKSDMARALQEHIHIEMKSAIDVLDQMKRPTRAGVRDWVEQCWESWARLHVLCTAYWEATTTDPTLAAEAIPVVEKLAASLNIMSSFPQGRARKKFHSRLVLIFLLMDRLFFLVRIEGRSETATRLLDEFAEMLWEFLFAGEFAAPRAKQRAE